MNEWLNNNQGVVAAVGVAIAVLTLLIGLVEFLKRKRAQQNKKIRLTGNISTGNGRDGIRLKGIQGDLKDNITSNNGGSGIDIRP